MKARALTFHRHSIAEVAYPKDAIVVCRACGKPLYRLQASIFLDERAGRRSNWKYAPVSVADLQTLMERSDLEPGQRAAIKAMSLDDQRLHCDRIQPIKDDDTPGKASFSDCPACGESFVFGKIDDDGGDGGARFSDKGFVIALAFIPPVGSARPLTLVKR
jgi:hypothetical protein